ncbi:hypothetical protein EB796_007915 [Bugula neritina]|uniref:Uncharacterized protein n=1 Tax=Bugula neritina TaxID=10212 RepID=A0A7J7K566_BUGNE|nr:hypothetical protein EB796_007915 [Bugula neritina]
MMVKGIKGRVVLKSYRKPGQVLGKHICFSLTTTDSAGKLMTLKPGDCGTIIYIKERDVFSPAGMLVGEVLRTASKPGFSSPVYQAIVLSQAFKDVESWFNIAPPAWFNIAPPAWFNIAPPAWFNIAPPAWFNIATPAWFNIAPPAWFNIAPPAWFNIAPPAWLDIAPPAWFNIAPPAWFNIAPPVWFSTVPLVWF